MKASTILLLCTLVALTLAKPNGVYHQEYNYKSSSSSYKNNELQHKNDDVGHYSKDGDLEGRLKPKIQSHSEHSEYVNPKLSNQYPSSSSGHYNQDADVLGQTSSYGQLNAQNRYGHNMGESMFGDAGSSMSAADGYSSRASYGSSTSYEGANSNLRQLSQRLQNELSRQLQDAIYDQHRQSSSYSNSISSSQIQSDTRQLEDELKRNLTMQLDEALKIQYGTQGVRGAYSYSISNGRLQPTANYKSQELQDLTQQLQNNLNRELQEGIRTQYQSQSSSSRISSTNTQHTNPYQTTIVQRPYIPSTGSHYPSSDTEYLPSGTQYPSSRTQYPSSGPQYPSSGTQYPSSGTHYPSSGTQYVPSGSQQMSSASQHLSSGSQYPSSQHNIQYTPISNSDSITTIATKVQDDLDEKLNRLLADTQRKYFSTNTYQYHSASNWDNILAQLQQELKRNLTSEFDNELRRNYGSSYSYSGSSGQSNYNTQDHDNLKQQIERNLITKLVRDFNRQKERYQQTYSGSSSATSGQLYETRPGYSYYPNTQVLPVKSGSSHSGGSSYNLLAGTRQSGYEIQQPSMNQADLSDIQRQLQENLSRQLQAAITKNQYSNSYSASASSSYNPQANYQTSLQHLTEELNRNLTDQLNTLLTQQYGSQYGQYGSSSSGSYSQSNSQLANLRNQLQNDLQKQLQQGLQQSYSRYSSWSSSSLSSSNYRPTRGYEPSMYKGSSGHNTGHNAGILDEDCMQGDDPMVYQHPAEVGQQVVEEDDLMLPAQRPYNSDNYRLTYGYGQNSRSRYDYSRAHQMQLTHGQYDYTGGQTSPSQQQHQRYNHNQFNSGNYQHGSAQQSLIGQDMDDSDLTQQTEDADFGQLEIGSKQTQQSIELGQQTDNSDLTQQTEDVGFGKLETGSQQRRNNQQSIQQSIDLAQQMDDSDLTQQTEDVGFGKLEIGNQQKPISNYRPGQQRNYLGQHRYDSDLTQQQTENVGFGKLEVGSQQRPQSYPATHQTIEQDQVIDDDSDLTQQTEEVAFGHQASDLGQQRDNSDLTQQVEDIGFGKLEVGNQQRRNNQQSTHQTTELGQQTDDSDLIQQTEDVALGKLEIGNQQRRNNHQSTQQSIDLGQQTEDLDLTQQTEDVGFGKLETGNQQRPNNYRPWQPASQVQQQQTDDLTQQTEDIGFGKLEVGNQQKPTAPQRGDVPQQQSVGIGLGQSNYNYRYRPWQPKNQIQKQQIDDSELNQQTEDDVGSSAFGVGSQQTSRNYRRGQQTAVQFGQTSNLDLTQQREQHVELGQQTDDSDLTQQTEEDIGFGKLEINNQHTSRNDQQRGDSVLNYPQREDDINKNQFQTTTQQNSRRHRTEQDIELSQQTDNLQNIPKTTTDDQIVQKIEQPIEPIVSGNKIYAMNDLTLHQTEDLDDFSKPSQQNVQDLTQQVEDDYYYLNNQRRQQTQTNFQIGQSQISEGINREQLAKQHELERASNQSQQLIDKLREKAQQNQQVNPSHGGSYIPTGNRPYQQTGTQQIRMTYNPRIVHYPTSEQQPQTHGLDQQQSIGVDEQQNRNLASSGYNSYQTYHSSYDHQNAHQSSQSEEHIRPVPGIIHYGTPSQVDEIVEISSEIEPIQPQQANIVQEVTDRNPSLMGVKTSHRVVQSQPADEIGPVTTINDEVEILSTTEKPGFWRRLGNKVKNSAQSIKEKIGI